MDNIIGDNIRKYREQVGLSQKQLAKKIGVSNSRLSNWEQGINNPPADFLGIICDALNISASELLGIKLSTDELNHEERKIIQAYRIKPDLQHAVKLILGIDRT